MIWLLPSWGRPAACQRTLDACEAAGMTAPGIVFIDGPTTPENDEAYKELRLPANWTAYFAPQRCRLVYQKQWLFSRHRDESAYGWLADDTPPRTPGFDQILARAAGDWNFAQANDLWSAQLSTDAVRSGRLMTSGMVWGGELVRAVGWFAWPALEHACIDVTWGEIIQELGCCRYLEDVIIEHLQWKNGKRNRDQYDVTAVDDDPVIRRDLEQLATFKEQKLAKRFANKVRSAHSY